MIYTFSREMVEFGLDLTEPYALISISTPAVYGPKGNAQGFNMDDHAAALPADEFRLDILRLAFWDVDESDLRSLGSDKWQAQVRLYSPEDARRVAAFVRAWAVNLVIHCDAGISRSQGMAAAISDHLDVPVKHSTPGMPNRHVYRITWEALRPRVLSSKLAPNSPALVPFKYEDAPVIPQTRPLRESTRRDPYKIRFTKDGAVERYERQDKGVKVVK